MRRPFFVSVLAVTALALLTIGGVAVASTGPRVTPPAKTVTISASNCAGGSFFCYKPAPLTVKRGTKVVWKNMAGVTHTVTRCTVAACGASGGTGKDTTFKTATIKVGKTFAFIFRQPGTYRYYCKIHGYATMHGTITVK